MDYKALAEAYPNLIPTAKAAELMEMHPNLLRERIKKGLYPFAEDCGDGVRPNIKIYTDRFIAWRKGKDFATEDVAVEAVADEIVKRILVALFQSTKKERVQ